MRTGIKNKQNIIQKDVLGYTDLWISQDKYASVWLGGKEHLHKIHQKDVCINS